MQAALTAGRTVVWEWDLRTDRVVRSPNAGPLLGLPVVSDARAGQTFAALIHPDDRERVRQAVTTALASGAPVATDFRLFKPDGSVVWVLDDGQIECDAEGRPLRMRGILRDITDRKTLETQLDDAHRQAQAANLVKDQFLATLSHELRTPLNVILGWARVLTTDRLDPDTTTRALQAIERNAQVQARLVDDLLDLARISAGKTRIDLRPVDLGLVIERAVDVVRPTADTKGVRLQVSLDPKAGPIMGDPDRLQQVVWNLLTNAVKFTPRGGRIQVFLMRVNSHVEVRVSDTGPGIPATLRPHLFEPFRQGTPEGSRPHGLGLGLSLVKHFVESHGGQVRAEHGGADEGATFTILLPLMIHAAPAGDIHPTAVNTWSPPSFASTLTGLRLLTIDDDGDALDLLAVMLRTTGAEVRVATSAREGLAILAAWSPDVILCDIEMPRESGYDFIQRLRAVDGPLAQVPAVAVTAYARTEDRVRALQAGFTVHVAKPVDPTELITVIRVLGRRSAERSDHAP